VGELWPERVAFRWTEESGLEVLEGLPEASYTFATAVSPNGQAVVGNSSEGAFYWTAESGMIALDEDLRGSFRHYYGDSIGYSTPLDVADTGVVVGYVRLTRICPDGQTEKREQAFRWTPEAGLQDIAVLLNSANASPGAKSLLQATGVSRDGTIVSGFGTNDPWLATLPLSVPTPPLPSRFIAGDYNGNGIVEQGDLNYVLLNWGTDTAPAGWVGYALIGAVDQVELDQVLLNWGAVDDDASAVPEPSTAVMGLVVLLAGLVPRWLRSSP
jgi:hypothetical protein